MRKRLTLDIIGISDSDRNVIKKIAVKKYGKPSISYFVKQLLCDILKDHNHYSTSHDSTLIEKRNRIETRLSKEEKKKLSMLAKPHHMTVNAFIASIIRNYLNKTPLLTAAEVDALYQSNAQLLRIGRNLNQIAKQFNSMEGGNITSEQVTALQNIINTHTEKVGELLLSNRRRNNE
ncbi:plasmid mobilization protein [Neisseria sp. Ec49-e6-T10]|uniref:plasmid mobilization protein n=1 Tax=Neisseria sp. Ec49-e6-T10 TaxID=3140744 RepID=UPI003EBCFDAC